MYVCMYVWKLIHQIVNISMYTLMYKCMDNMSLHTCVCMYVNLTCYFGVGVFVVCER